MSNFTINNDVLNFMDYSYSQNRTYIHLNNCLNQHKIFINYAAVNASLLLSIFFAMYAWSIISQRA